MTVNIESAYGLLIAVNDNSVPEWVLPDVAKDVDAFAAVLTHPERCGYAPEHVQVLKGPDATRQKILDGIEALQAKAAADPEATVVVYYSGHGCRDAESSPPGYYLIPYDVRRDKLRSTALRAEDLAEAIAAVQPRRLLVVLDCCHAGGMDVKDVAAPLGRYAPAAAPPELFIGGADAGAKAIDDAGTSRLMLGAGRAVLSSSSRLQSSYLRADHSMSIFTYHLIEAFTGHAQPQDGATEVLASDVLGYVFRKVPRSAMAQWGREQQPDGRLTGNFAVALLLGGKGLGKGEPAPDPVTTLSAAAVLPGAVHTGGGDFVGRDRIVYGDVVHGDKVGGDKVAGDKILFQGPVTADVLAVGSGAQATSNRGMDSTALAQVLAPVQQAIASGQVDAARRAAAEAKLSELQAELGKGKAADDNRLARIVDGIVDLVPGAVADVTAAFASPILAGVAGPVTRFVLERITGKA